MLLDANVPRKYKFFKLTRMNAPPRNANTCFKEAQNYIPLHGALFPKPVLSCHLRKYEATRVIR